MFVYAIKISELPSEINATPILNQHFPDTQSKLEGLMLAGDQVTIYQPVQDGDLFFGPILRKMEESFTKLSDQGWRFLVLRKHYDDKYKLVASYDESLKIGRRAWRKEHQRIEAISKSFESFLFKEGTPEDMEILRPLFPKDINRLLRLQTIDTTEGEIVLQQSCPTLTASDSRRIFSQMKSLYEKRALQWKNRFNYIKIPLILLILICLTYFIFQ